ncbi:TPA: ATP:cob(I)alamin adenosyltransferase [Candidatus Micrarchaeota archaeon]|nr:ATP:cob(I)alamin adenosyltransferase [Candidatus Micrarchaeota archaeon]
MAEDKIYTKKGDSGNTKTLAGGHVKKNSPVIVANGKLDSLQASLDAAKHECKGPKFKHLRDAIDSIQEKLWQTGGEVSFARVGGPVKNPVEEANVTQLEKWIDGLCAGKQFKHFIRVHSAAAIALNESRVRCREAEISLVPLLDQGKLRPVVFKYVNRLSDYLYAAACHCEGRKKG